MKTGSINIRPQWIVTGQERKYLLYFYAISKTKIKEEKIFKNE